MVREHIRAGRLKQLEIRQSEGLTMAIHVVRQRGVRLGPASRWLIEDVRKRLADWTPCGGSTEPKEAARKLLHDAG
jgi:DNA-binding transcriptional LysR family regulator